MGGVARADKGEGDNLTGETFAACLEREKEYLDWFCGRRRIVGGTNQIG